MPSKRIYKIIETRLDGSEILKEFIIHEEIADELYDIISSVNDYKVINDATYYGLETHYPRYLWIWEQILKPVQIIVNKIEKDIAEEKHERI